MNLGKLFIIQKEFKVAKYNTEYLKIKLTSVRRCYLGMNIENELKEIQKNLQSTISNVYISNDNKYVIKIYNDIEHTITMTNLHRVLNENNLYVPMVIHNSLNEEYTIFEDKYIVVYSFLKGHQIVWNTDKINLTDYEINKLAKTVRNLHDVTNNEIIVLPQLSLGNDMERKSVLHFDLTRNNIFIDSEQDKIGFIDFDDAKFGASVCDVAILISNLFFSKSKGANLEDMHKFIDAYYEEDLKIKEVEVPRIKEFALMWIDYVLDGNEFNASTTESFEARKKLINRHL